MQWQNFYPKWLSLIGKIDREILSEWNEFVSGSDSGIILAAIDELAEKYNLAKEKDNFASMPNLWQFKKACERIRARHHRQVLQMRQCGFCENSATVYVLDTGNYASDEFPVDPASYEGRRSLCVVPCPVCRKENYEGMPGLLKRITAYCRPYSKRNELYKLS